MPFLHQIWYQGSAPARFNKFRNTLNTVNKEFTIMLHDSHQLQEACASVSPHVLKAYNSGNMFQRIDLGRYVVLYKYGGVSCDMDAYANKPLMPLYKKLVGPNHVLVVSRMDHTNKVYEILQNSLEFVEISPILANNAHMICTKHNPAMLAIINSISDRILTYNGPETAMIKINATTGPWAFSVHISELYDTHQHKIVYVKPRVLEVIVDANTDYKGNAIFVHVCEGSWFARKTSMLNLFLSRNISKYVISAIAGGMLYLFRKCGGSMVRVTICCLVLVATSQYYELSLCQQENILCSALDNS